MLSQARKGVSLMSRTVVSLLFAATLVGGTGAQSLLAADAPVAVRELKREFPGVRHHVDGQGIASVYGQPMTKGATPEQAVRRFLDRYSDVLGVPGLSVQLQRRNETDDGRFTIFAFGQDIGGVPVENGIARILVRNGVEDAVVMASGKLVPARSFPEDVVSASEVRDRISGRPRTQHLTVWTEPELVIFASEDGTDLEDPVRAWKFTGSNPDLTAYEAFTFFVDAATGDLVHVRDEVYDVDVTGTVSGLATPGTLPDEGTNPPVSTPLGNARVRIQGGSSVFANTDGTFTIPNGGISAVTVEVDLVGQWVNVLTDQGTLVHAEQTVTPPGPVNFDLNNPASQFNTAQVNAFLHTTGVHDFFKSRAPGFTALDIPITCNTNIASSCNAFYSSANQSINFYNAQGGCVNTAFSDVVYHEYGHFIVNRLGLAQGAFGEGYGDCIALMALNHFILGQNFLGPGTSVRDYSPGSTDVQYPCAGEVHFCGEVLGGCWVKTRENIVASDGAGGLDYVRQLFIDWSLVTLGGQGTNGAHPQTAIEVLTIDDDDADLGNGTPHYNEICAAFGAHNVDCPVLPGLNFSYPNGIPDFLVPLQATTVRVDVAGGTEGNPVPGSGTVSYRVNGGAFTTDPMNELSSNMYEFTLPAADCFDQVEFFVSAQGTGGGTVSDPSAGAGNPRSSVVATGVNSIFADDFETDTGWAVVNESLLDGPWERGVPAGDGSRGDPLTDFDGSGQCYLTDNVIGNSDVDEGPTRLVSPVIDTGGIDADISYAYWMYNDDNNDAMTVEISNNGGGSWTVARTYLGGLGGWLEDSFRISDFTTPTANMQVRFSVQDVPNDSVTEAAIDAFSIAVLECDPPGDAPDLSVNNAQVDYDPADGDVDGGPGAISQAVDVLVTIENGGNIPILSATIQVDANVAGGAIKSASTLVTDFDSAPGTQSLGVGATAIVRVSFAPGELDRCGTYTLVATHDAGSLESMGMAGSVFGDIRSANDSLTDHPDDESNPNDDFTPDLLELDFGTFVTSIQAVSEVIEDINTEKVKVDIAYTGLGPGGDSHDIRLLVDLTDLAGNPVYLNVFNRSRNGVRSNGSRNVTIRVDLSALFPAPGPGDEFRVRLRLRDLDSTEVCIEELSSNSFVVQ